MKKNFSVSSPLQMSEVLGKMCKSMKKTLTSSEHEKGVHKPILKDPKGGKSHLGALTEMAHNTKKQGSTRKEMYAIAGKIADHKKIMSELKDMPKPKLTRSELEKFDQHLQKSWKPKSIEKASPAPAPAPKPAQPAMPKMKPAKMKQPTIKAPAPKAPDMQMSEHEKGVHKPVKAMGLKGGMSHAGLDARVAKEPSVQNHPVAQISLDESKSKHKEKLSELKQMPKPKLTKADIEAFDQKLQSMKKKP